MTEGTGITSIIDGVFMRISKDELNAFSVEIMDKIDAFIKQNGGTVNDSDYDKIINELDLLLEASFPGIDYRNYN